MVAPHVMAAICDTKTPQGVAAVASMPEPPDIRLGFIVALDDVQDPANVGTIIRTADAAGCGGVVLSDGSADPYAPKVVRASMGSLFHLPVVRTALRPYLEELRESGYRVACADLDGQTDFSLAAEKTCLVIGNEARGISEEILCLSDVRVRIPIYGKAESLNAAVAAGDTHLQNPLLIRQMRLCYNSFHKCDEAGTVAVQRRGQKRRVPWLEASARMKGEISSAEQPSYMRDGTLPLQREGRRTGLAAVNLGGTADFRPMWRGSFCLVNIAAGCAPALKGVIDEPFFWAGGARKERPSGDRKQPWTD